MDLIGIVFFVGFLLFVVGVLVFIAESLPSRSPGSRKAAGWMIVTGFALCLADFLFLWWLAATVGS
jgi:hypothetical protein